MDKATQIRANEAKRAAEAAKRRERAARDEYVRAHAAARRGTGTTRAVDNARKVFDAAITSRERADKAARTAGR
jgi:hypothetical protein